MSGFIVVATAASGWELPAELMSRTFDLNHFVDIQESAIWGESCPVLWPLTIATSVDLMSD